METVSDDNLKGKNTEHANAEMVERNVDDANGQRHEQMDIPMQKIQQTIMADQNTETVASITDTLPAIIKQEHTSVEDRADNMHEELDLGEQTQIVDETSVTLAISATTDMKILENQQTKSETEQHEAKVESCILNSSEKGDLLLDTKMPEAQKQNKREAIEGNTISEHLSSENDTNMQVGIQSVTEENASTAIELAANTEMLTQNAFEQVLLAKENESDTQEIGQIEVGVCENMEVSALEEVTAAADESVTGVIKSDTQQELTQIKSALVTTSDTSNNMEVDSATAAKTTAIPTVSAGNVPESFMQTNIMEETISVSLDPLPTNDITANRSDTVKNSLSLLADYISDDSDEDDSKAGKQNDAESDGDSIVEVPVTSNKTYRSQVVTVDTESDSSSASESGDEGDYLAEIRKNIEKAIQVDSDDGDGTDSFPPKHAKPLKTKGELSLEDLPPIADLHITVPEEECIELGVIHSIVDQLVLVSVLPNSVLLDLDTILFLDKGNKVLGQVFDVLGQVADPMYCIRFNSNKQIKEKGIQINDKVYAAPKTEYTQFVVLANLMKVRGSDASWEHDLEPPPKFLDYSDDEEERASKYLLRNKDRPMESKIFNKRSRTDEELQSTTNESGTSNNYVQQERSRYRTNRRHGNYTTNNRAHQSPSPSPQRYNSGSWHSNYYPYAHPSAAAGPHYYAPQNYYRQEGNMHVRPPPPPQGYNYYPPPPPMPYQMAPPMVQPMMPPTEHIPQPVQPPTSQYVVNPYAIRPPVLQSNKSTDTKH